MKAVLSWWSQGRHISRNHVSTAIETTIFEITSEQLILYLWWQHTGIAHLVWDSVLHVLMNLVHIHPDWIAKKRGKKAQKAVEIGVDSVMHIGVKYWWHVGIELIESLGDSVEKMCDHNGRVMALAVWGCTIVGQIKKNFFDKNFHHWHESHLAWT